MEFPLVDLQASDATIHAAIDQACKAPGLFLLQGHDITPSSLQAFQTSNREFFQLALTQKNKIRRTADNPWGYFDTELTKNRRDWKEILDIGPPNVANQGDDTFANANPQWPTDPAALKPLAQQHMQRCETLAQQLLGYVADNLNTPRQQLQQQFGESHTSFLRLNFYPTCADAAISRPNDAALVATQGELGISHHTDAGALTLLLQDDVSGLQVWHDGLWTTVPVTPETLVVNIGDVVQVWSNNAYRAPVHRVLANAAQERLSAAYFYNPSYAATYAPLESTGQPQYAPIKWGEFRSGRAAGDYADTGEELQISHYAIEPNNHH